MIDFENMKCSYAATIQLALFSGATQTDVKQYNDILHKFCNYIIEYSGYCDSSKSKLKQDLYFLKALQEQEIELYFQHL